MNTPQADTDQNHPGLTRRGLLAGAGVLFGGCISLPSIPKPLEIEGLTGYKLLIAELESHCWAGVEVIQTRDSVDPEVGLTIATSPYNQTSLDEIRVTIKGNDGTVISSFAAQRDEEKPQVSSFGAPRNLDKAFNVVDSNYEKLHPEALMGGFLFKTVERIRLPTDLDSCVIQIEVRVANSKTSDVAASNTTLKTLFDGTVKELSKRIQESENRETQAYSDR